MSVHRLPGSRRVRNRTVLRTYSRSSFLLPSSIFGHKWVLKINKGLQT
jgi:hypothetical protein